MYTEITDPKEAARMADDILEMVKAEKKEFAITMANLRYEWEKNTKVAGRPETKAPF
jgi:hypothetical protein